jgi:hypothetical protein
LRQKTRRGLEMDEATKGAKLRHCDVIGVALRLIEEKLHSPEQQEVIQAAPKEAEGTHGEIEDGTVAQ